MLIMVHHEPWFDEAQAWLIARDASFIQLVTSITHYEGHPPIWFLILMPFAKLGVPFELGLKIVNFSLVTIAMGIFIFKAPFPRIIRCTVPFTYFCFYQYGVISRPYSLMMLGFILSALFFKERNERPFRFTTGLALICSASVYGIIIAAAIVMVWIYDIYGTRRFSKPLVRFWGSNISYALVALFIYNIFLLLTIYPYVDTFAMNAVVQKRDHFTWLVHMFFIAPAESVCTSVWSGNPNNANMTLQMGLGLFISCLINVIIYDFASQYNKAALFVLPYTVLAVFGGIVYFSTQHIGVLIMFYMFLLWCCSADRNEGINYKETNKLYWYVGTVLLSVCIGTSLYWTCTASVNDMRLNYGTGREAAKFIKENRFDQLRIMVAWRVIENEKTGETVNDYNSTDGLPSLAYFDRNIFINFNNQADNKCFLSHQVDNEGVSTNRLIREGNPDVLFITASPYNTFGNKISIQDYTLVKSVQGGNAIWKDQIMYNRQFIFLRNDLMHYYPDLKGIRLDDEIIQSKKWKYWGYETF